MTQLTFEDLAHNPNGSAKGVIKIGEKILRYAGFYPDWKKNFNEASLLYSIVQKNKAEAETWLRLAKKALPQRKHKYQNKANDLFKQNATLKRIALRNPIFTQTYENL